MSQVTGFLKKTVHSYTKKLLKEVQNRAICCTSYVLSKKVPFLLSDIGEGIREVVVKEWFVKTGDKISQFENICEVQSDKASVTITSRYDGVITKLYYNVDEIAFVGQPLVDIETDEKADQNDAPAVASKNVNILNDLKESPQIVSEILETPVDTSSSDENTILCIPSVRRLAKEHHIDLSKIKGSGKHCRILKEDILKYLEKPAGKPVEENEERISSHAVHYGKDDVKIEPIKGFTKAMVKTMTESLKIPHFGYSDEIKVTRLSKLRKELKTLPQLKDTKITFLPFFIKAASNALHHYPIINSSVDNICEHIIYHKHHNIGIAMDTKAGLAVPVIKNVESLSVIEVAKELNKLIQAGKSGSFALSDLTGATFSISNIGTIGGTYTKPVILPPQVAIIAIGMTQVLPKFDESMNIIAEEIINISSSADHRVVDGVSMANFINILKKQIENPNLLFLNV